MTTKLKILKIAFRAALAIFLCAVCFSPALAESNDGIYQGRATSGSCGGTFLVNISDGKLTGVFENSEGSSNLSGSVTDGGHIEFSGGGYSFFGVIDNGVISGSGEPEDHSQCGFFSFELARISTGEEISQSAFSSIQELNSRKEVTEKIVNEVFIKDDPTLTPGTTEIAPTMSATTEYQSLNIPFSYSYSDSLKIKGEIPVFYADESFYLGNVSGNVTYYSGNIEEQLVLSSLRLDLPTGDKKVGGGGLNAQAGQSRVIDFERSRMFVSYYYMYTSEVDNFNTGDSLDLALGLDFSFNKPTLWIGKVYGILTGQMVTEAKYEDLGMNDGKTLLDMTLGLVFDRWNMRAGLSFPVMTLSDKINNSDRLISMDVGFHWGSK